MKKLFTLEIEVGDDIEKKYPNYNINYDSKEEFIDSIIENICYQADTDLRTDGLDQWGYSINVHGNNENPDFYAQDTWKEKI